jgi:hypothetical protein
VCTWRGHIDEVAREGDFLESHEVLNREMCLDTCCSAALVDGDDIRSGDSRGLSLGAGHTPGYVGPGGDNTQGGARRRQIDLLHLPRQLDQPTAQGGRREGGVGCCSLACTGAL